MFIPDHRIKNVKSPNSMTGTLMVLNCEFESDWCDWLFYLHTNKSKVLLVYDNLIFDFVMNQTSSVYCMYRNW